MQLSGLGCGQTHAVTINHLRMISNFQLPAGAQWDKQAALSATVLLWCSWPQEDPAAHGRDFLHPVCRSST